MAHRGAQRKLNSKPAWKKAANIFVLLVLLGVFFYISFRVVDKFSIKLFTFHPLFNVFGYLILMSNAILIMAEKHILTMNSTPQERATQHWIIQVCAVLLITIAQASTFINKVKHDQPHFQTTHSIIGLVTYIFTITSVLFGLFAKYSHTLKNKFRQGVIKIAHSFLGITTYALAVFNIVFGFRQMFIKQSDEIMSLLIIIVLLIATTIYVLFTSFLMTLGRAAKLQRNETNPTDVFLPK